MNVGAHQLLLLKPFALAATARDISDDKKSLKNLNCKSKPLLLVAVLRMKPLVSKIKSVPPGKI